MDLSNLTRKTLQVSRGFSYTYYTSPAKENPTVILFHGWPDTALLWSGLINDFLIPYGYGVIALDCLGYGGSSKPTDPALYAFRHLAADVVEILDHESLNRVISFGHDWGSVMAQRLYNHYPLRVSGLAMINVAYAPVTGLFELDLANKLTTEAFGYGPYEYWHFFTSDDGFKIMNQNLESVYAVAHGDPDSWLQTFCRPGGMRKFISEHQTQPTLPYATSAHRSDFFDRFEADGFEAPTCWYKSWTLGIQNTSNGYVAEEAKGVTVPALYWGGKQDPVCNPALLTPSIDAGLLPNLTVQIRDGGHWALLQSPLEFGQDVLGWLEKTFN